MVEPAGIKDWPPRALSAPSAHWTMLLVGIQLAILGIVSTVEALAASGAIREFRGGTSGSYGWGGNLGMVAVAFQGFDWVGIVAAAGVLTIVAAVAAFRDRHHWVVALAAVAWLVLVLPSGSVEGMDLVRSAITLLACLAAALWRSRSPAQA